MAGTERKLVEKAIGKAVPLKETGVILPAEQGGGALTFIGEEFNEEQRMIHCQLVLIQVSGHNLCGIQC